MRFFDHPDRPWPLPRRPWAMSMRWHDLLFVHWPVDASVLRPLIPPSLELETFDGTAWIGVVPFRMSGIRARFCPPVPGTSAFPELNVRTYVTAGGKRGVWFFSLDATNRLAVRVARKTFFLNYCDAAITCPVDAGTDRVSYRSVRTHRNMPPAEFQGTYEPTGPVYHAKPGTIDHFLTERYCLYSAAPDGRTFRGEIAHRPWPLHPAKLDLRACRMTEQIGVTLPTDVPPLLHYAKLLEVVAWLPQRVAEEKPR